MINAVRSLYNVFKMEDTKIFQPKEYKLFSFLNENAHAGLHLTVNQRIMVLVNAFASDCQTNAQTPNPRYAMVSPTMDDMTTAPNVAKKRRLNCKVFETYECWMWLTPYMINDNPITRTIFVSSGNL